MFHEIATIVPAESPPALAESRLARWLQAEFRLASPELIAPKLGADPAALAALFAFVEAEGPAPADPAPLLARLQRATTAIGAGDRWLEALAGAAFPLASVGVRWQRRLGPRDPALEAFDRALGKLRLGRWGLHVQRRVAIAGEAVDWAIAGLLPSGAAVRLALVVRPAPETPTALGALREDLADDRVAAAGFAILAFRDWQLRFAGACAWQVAAFLAEQAPFLRAPEKLQDPDDDHPVHRLQASPVRATPREASPNWALREALRRAMPQAGPEGLLAAYHDQLVEGSQASAEAEEWTPTG